MRVLVTGADGFIGKNLVSHLELIGADVLRFTREHNIADLERLVGEADFVFHLAGVNRPQNEEEFATHNAGLTESIVALLQQKGGATPLVVSSSTQVELDNSYGRSKLAAERAAVSWGHASDAPVFVYRLPGVFGKWCRPNYNSVVATFCHNLTRGIPLTVNDPSHRLTLAYIDDVVMEFASLLERSETARGATFREIPRTFTLTIGELRERLESIQAIRDSLVVPDATDPLNSFLYATYVSYLDESDFAYDLRKNSDERGWLAEFVKSKHFGQVFISKTRPGISRGNHWHKTKIEKFLVVEGDGEIAFRNKIDAQDIIRYRVNGDQMRVVDIPVGYVHSITNVGNTDLITIFWASEVFDPEHPDTFFEAVAE